MIAGCTPWIIPATSDSVYRQQVQVSKPENERFHLSERPFPERTDLVRGRPDKDSQVLIRRMPNIPASVEPTTGAIEIVFVIEATGSVKDAKLLKSSGNPTIDSLYLDAVRTWSYRPAVNAGKPVAQLVRQEFSINLTD
jgi:TonB family protein